MLFSIRQEPRMYALLAQLVEQLTLKKFDNL